MNLRKLITRYLVETFNLYRWATSCVILNYLWNNNLCKLGTCPTKISSELLAVTNCYCVQVQLQWLVRHQLPKNKSELEQSPLKKISIIKLDLAFFFHLQVFYLILFLFGLHGATSLYIWDPWHSTRFDLSFLCSNLSLYSFFFILLANRNLDHVNMLSKERSLSLHSFLSG